MTGMDDGANPYASPGAESGILVPGYYACDMRRLSLRELWRMSPTWAYPLVVLMVKLGALNRNGNYIYLPATASDERCAEEEIPERVRASLEPLLRTATAAGFAVRMWGMDQRSVQTSSAMESGGVYLFNGRDTACWLVSVQGHAQGNPVGKTLVSFGSIARDSGLMLSTRTEDRGFDHHPHVRTTVVRGADFATLLAAHQARLRDGDFAISADAYFRRLDVIGLESWEARVRNGLYRRVAGTREELLALIGPRAGA
jgi:hypothetical protein